MALSDHLQSFRWRAATPNGIAVALALLIIAAMATVLLLMGRTPICTCGAVKLWQGVVNSSDNSQHISDWYSFSHVIHGFLFYGMTWLVARRLPISVRLCLALVIECGWEIFENTDFVINRYREATIALDYYGDSVLNSVCDVGFMVIGFFLASRLPVWLTVVIGLAMEIFTVVMIRDNLTLNILMLLWPLDAVRRWQSGGG